MTSSSENDSIAISKRILEVAELLGIPAPIFGSVYEGTDCDINASIEYNEPLLDETVDMWAERVIDRGAHEEYVRRGVLPRFDDMRACDRKPLASLGPRLQYLRTMRGDSLEDQARLFGCSSAEIAAFENGEVSPPASFIAAACYLYNCDANYILFGIQRDRNSSPANSSHSGNGAAKGDEQQ
ncbi:MAG: helix-turn-helix transcriptional regulator [Pseudomonadota bacterium]